MVKYINALEFKKEYLEQPKVDPGVIFTVDDMPAADVSENVHGRWIACQGYGVAKCSVCDWVIEEEWHSNYCPGCGAKMDSYDGKESEEK